MILKDKGAKQGSLGEMFQTDGTEHSKTVSKEQKKKPQWLEQSGEGSSRRGRQRDNGGLTL